MFGSSFLLFDLTVVHHIFVSVSVVVPTGLEKVPMPLSHLGDHHVTYTMVAKGQKELIPCLMDEIDQDYKSHQHLVQYLQALEEK